MVEAMTLVERLRKADPFVNDPISLKPRLRNPDGPEAADRIEQLEALHDSAYHAGLKAGWNYCVRDDNAGMQAVLNNTDHIKELRRVRKALALTEIKHGQ